MKKSAFTILIFGIILLILFEWKIEFRNEKLIWLSDGGLILVGLILLVILRIIDIMNNDQIKSWRIIFPTFGLIILSIFLVFSLNIGNKVYEDSLIYQNNKSEIIVQKFEVGILGNDRYRCILKRKDFFVFRFIDKIEMPEELKGFPSTDSNTIPTTITFKDKIYSKK